MDIEKWGDEEVKSKDYPPPTTDPALVLRVIVGRDPEDREARRWLRACFRIARTRGRKEQEKR